MAYEPDGTIVTVGGLDFTRTLPKQCPQCKQTFWAYQAVGHEKQPYREDPEPYPGQTRCGARETCDDPNCQDAEQEHQMQRRIEFRKRHVITTIPEPSSKPRLVRGNGKLQPLGLGATS